MHSRTNHWFTIHTTTLKKYVDANKSIHGLPINNKWSNLLYFWAFVILFKRYLIVYFKKVVHTYFHWLRLPPNLTYGTWTRTEDVLAFNVGDATIYKKKERKMEQIFGKRWIHIGAHFNAQNYIYGKRDIDLNHFYLLHVIRTCLFLLCHTFFLLCSIFIQ